MRFTSEQNGLELDYEIVDEEIAGGATPFPATRMSGEHTEIVGVSAKDAVGEVRLRLEGPKNVPKGAIDLAIGAANRKLIIAPGTGSGQQKHVMEHFSIMDIISDELNAVEVQMRVRHIGFNTRDSLGALVIARIGEPIIFDSDSDDDTATLLSPYGTAALARSFACHLQSPCGRDHSMPSGTFTLNRHSARDERGVQNIGGARITIQQVKQLPPFQLPQFTSAHETAIYQHYQIDVVYDIDEHVVALPIASTNSQAVETVKVITLANPSCKMTVRIAAESGTVAGILARQGFTNNGIKHHVLKYKANARAPELMGDGVNRIFVMDAEIVYQLARPPRPGEKIASANLPWDEDSPSESNVPDESFVSPESFYK